MLVCNDTFCGEMDAQNSSVESEDGPGFRNGRHGLVVALQSAVMALIILLSILGNALVLTAIYRDRLLRNSASVYVANLAVADLLNGALTMPFILACSVVGEWPFGPALCSVAGALATLFCSTSVFTLGTIALDRYIAVIHPLKYHTLMTRGRIVSLIVVTWFHATILAAIPMMGWSAYIYIEEEYLCTADWGGTPSYTFIVFAIDLGIPVTTMLFCYYHILKAARKQTRRVAALQIFSKEKDEKGSAQMTKRPKSSIKAAITLLAVIGTFLVCWLPHTVTMVCLGRPDNCNIPDAMFVVSTWLAMYNSACNPLIYGILNRQFRQAFRDIICGWKAGKETAIKEKAGK